MSHGIIFVSFRIELCLCKYGGQMKKFNLLPFLVAFPFILFAQSGQLNFNDYRTFINSHKDMESSELIEMYPTALFKKNSGVNFENSLYADSVKLKYGLTDYEISLLQDHGFVVTERLRDDSFGKQFSEIYHNDLPVFISTDAILHPFHVSYDKLLKEVEVKVLIPKLKTLLSMMHEDLVNLHNKYSAISGMEKSLADVDVYLTVPLKLLKLPVSPYYSDNTEKINNLLEEINNYQPVKEFLFSTYTKRVIDFSQFKPRAHYTDEIFPELSDYFKAMMWLGRIELYLIAPQEENPVNQEDIQRQTVDAVLLKEILDDAQIQELYYQIENIIKSFVGDQDNVTLANLIGILNDVNIASADELLDEQKFQEFQNDLAEKSFADQKILSYILFKDPTNPDSIKPASAFLLFGQRFVIDSYITGNVVFDKIKYQDKNVLRMLPVALDMLFPLGNNAALQLLQGELDKYHYATNLAGLRYLIDSFDSTFWYGSVYSAWLNAIRTLNPPEDRTGLPGFMQTAAWWQEKMNTQLAAWSQLRHDNLLYAKPSYSGSVICSFPYGYVEPVPEFFQNIGSLAELLREKIDGIEFEDKAAMVEYLTFFKSVSDTLESIAIKELEHTPFTNGEISFLKRLIYNNPDHICGAPEYLGWYPKLFYNADLDNGFYKRDFVIADYHTAPTDEMGNMVGWVKHAGTGPVDLAFVVAPLPDGKTVTFTGPVMSFREITTNSFFRITDEDWEQTYLAESTRPAWVNIYLANSEGKSRGEGPQLLTGLNDGNNKPIIPDRFITAKNYPNPFNPSTKIMFTIPQNLETANTTLVIYDLNGREIKKLVNGKLQPGTYIIEWDGTNEKGEHVSSGVYFYKLKGGAQQFVGKMNLIR